MDEALVSRWNAVVRPFDKVYLLGDVVISRKNLVTVGRLNGKKRLIAGNHDLFARDYPAYFDEIHGVKVWGKREIGFDMIMSHVPLHKACITARFGTNVHGHLHANRVEMKKHGWLPDFKWNRKIDPRYLNVCCEQTNYTPISFEEVRSRIEAQQHG